MKIPWLEKYNVSWGDEFLRLYCTQCSGGLYECGLELDFWCADSEQFQQLSAVVHEHEQEAHGNSAQLHPVWKLLWERMRHHLELLHDVQASTTPMGLLDYMETRVRETGAPSPVDQDCAHMKTQASPEPESDPDGWEGAWSKLYRVMGLFGRTNRTVSSLDILAYMDQVAQGLTVSLSEPAPELAPDVWREHFEAVYRHVEDLERGMSYASPQVLLSFMDELKEGKAFTSPENSEPETFVTRGMVYRLLTAIKDLQQDLTAVYDAYTQEKAPTEPTTWTDEDDQEWDLLRPFRDQHGQLWRLGGWTIDRVPLLTKNSLMSCARLPHLIRVYGLTQDPV